jgi:hypothetical protein
LSNSAFAGSPETTPKCSKVSAYFFVPFLWEAGDDFYSKGLFSGKACFSGSKKTIFILPMYSQGEQMLS